MDLNYFDILPKELNIIIASHLFPSNERFDVLKEQLRILKVLNVADLRGIVNLYIPEYSDHRSHATHSVAKDYIKDEFGRNISHLDMLLLLYFIRKVENRSNIWGERYNDNLIKLENVVYRKKFSNKFVGLYQIMKNFDLSAVGKSNQNYIFVHGSENKIKWQEWMGLYTTITDYVDPDFSPTLIEFIRTGKLPHNYIYDGNIPIMEFVGFSRYILFAMAFANNFKFELQTSETNYYLLSISYESNTDVYNKLREIISSSEYKRIITDFSNHFEYIYDGDNFDDRIILVEYIRERASEN